MELQKFLHKFLKRRKVTVPSDNNVYLRNELRKILGCDIINSEFYKEAFSLKSSTKDNLRNYERLEFLGDSILGSIISAHLFLTYPNENEGFLTQLKSKIVNRKNLNKIGNELGLTSLIQGKNQHILGENINGNLFEALIGAIFLDLGYENCTEIVLSKLLTPVEMNNLKNKIISYKGLLLEWSQKKKIPLRYETCEEILPNKSMVFRSHIWFGEQNIANATESSKKKAEEKAAQRAFYILNKKQHILESSKTAS